MAKQTTNVSSKNGELNETELGLLNNLMYIKSITNDEYKNYTIKEFINDIRKKGVNKLDNPEDKFDYTDEQLDKLLTAVEKDVMYLNQELSRKTNKYST